MMPAERAAWGTISRAQVVDAALELIARQGYGRLTIRRLADELGVAPMSLYRHVRDKDDLLDEVVDRLMGDSWKPRTRRSDWRAWVAEASEKLRRFLVGEPTALYVFLRHPVLTPSNLARMRAMIEVLRQAGFDERSAHQAYAAVHTYTIGFAAFQASREAAAPPSPGDDQLAAELHSFATPRQFALGLACLLDGIELRAAAQPIANGGR